MKWGGGSNQPLLPHLPPNNTPTPQPHQPPPPGTRDAFFSLAAHRAVDMRRAVAIARKAKWQPQKAESPAPPAPPVEPWRAWPEPDSRLGVPVHLDKHLLCLNKPAGVRSQPDISGEKCATQLSSEWLGSRATCVHRLDRWATGCLLLARSQRAASRCAKAFEQQQTTKQYLVIVRSKGGTSLPPTGSVGRIERRMSLDRKGHVHVDWPSTRHTKSRDAVLTWHSLSAERGAAGGRHALLAVGIRGGFKHQVRRAGAHGASQRAHNAMRTQRHTHLHRQPRTRHSHAHGHFDRARGRTHFDRARFRGR
jgi:23S rRNA-/tRNA-specific pseudouridylate synthase